MIGNITYALILIVAPGAQAEVQANFATAADCRAERRAVMEDLAESSIVAVCVPQNRVSINEAMINLKSMYNAMIKIPLPE